MKLKYIIGATALSLLLAGAAYPQQEQEKEKPAEQQEKPAEKPKEQPKQTPKKQTTEKRQQEQTKQDQHAAKQQQDQEKQQQQSGKKQQEQQKQMTKQQQDEQKQQQRQQQQVARQQHQQSDQQQRDTQRSDRDHGRRIPDDRFRASFGREHTFRVERRDDRRFQFGGFWFAYSEPWPVEWAYTDDVFVDYIDGEYYLIDLRHPGVRLLLIVE